MRQAGTGPRCRLHGRTWRYHIDDIECWSAGEAWLTFDGEEPLRLAQGDFLLLPTTPPFSLSSVPSVRCAPVEPRNEAVRYGEQEGEPDFVALGGSFAFERVNAPLLLSLLPDRIHIPTSAGKATRFGRLIDLLAEECADDNPGRDLFLQRMREALLIEALRWQGVGTDGSAVAGLLSGMRDPAIARALRAIHADVALAGPSPGSPASAACHARPFRIGSAR